MQVAAEDEFADYVICRGYDPRIKKYFDYVEGDADKVGIPVAKPWSNRSTGVYTVGHVFPAVLPLTRLGQNPGVAATSEGQPADLDEEVEILTTTAGEPYDEERVINWLLLDQDMIACYELTERGPRWDDDEKAYKIQGKALSGDDETKAATIFGAASGSGLTWLWFPREWSWDDGKITALPFYFNQQRVYTAWRNGRREIISSVGNGDDNWWSSYLLGSDGEMPACGVGMLYVDYQEPHLYSSYGSSRWRDNRTRMFKTGFDFTAFVVNCPIASSLLTLKLTVNVTDAVNKPVWALCDDGLATILDTVDFSPNASWGPVWNSWLMWPGLPGFRLFLDYDSPTKSKDRVYVSSYYGVCRAKVISWTSPSANSDYLYHVAANPTTSAGDFVYDGSTQSGVTFPAMQIDILIPVSANTLNNQEPNLQAGDTIRYRAIYGTTHAGLRGRLEYHAEGNYMDDPIGTVKMWNGAVANIPKGWRAYSALDGKFPLGDNSGALGSGTFGTTGTDYDYAEIRFIERYE